MIDREVQDICRTLAIRHKLILESYTKDDVLEVIEGVLRQAERRFARVDVIGCEMEVYKALFVGLAGDIDIAEFLSICKDKSSIEQISELDDDAYKSARLFAGTLLGYDDLDMAMLIVRAELCQVHEIPQYLEGLTEMLVAAFEAIEEAVVAEALDPAEVMGDAYLRLLVLFDKVDKKLQDSKLGKALFEICEDEDIPLYSKMAVLISSLMMFVNSDGVELDMSKFLSYKDGSMTINIQGYEK